MAVSENASHMLPPGMRSQAYALIDLLLTLVELARHNTQLDPAEMLIRLVIAEATLHPLLAQKAKPTEMLNWPVLPASIRGSISRVLIAERADLPRETVRRKVNALIASGKIEDAGHGKVRGTDLLTRPDAPSDIAAAIAAVNKCHARLAALTITQPVKI